MADDRLISLNAAVDIVCFECGELNGISGRIIEKLEELTSVDSVEADGTAINTASDFCDGKGKRINNPKTYKSIYGESKDGGGNV